jgi:hypothetical protein
MPRLRMSEGLLASRWRRASTGAAARSLTWGPRERSPQYFEVREPRLKSDHVVCEGGVGNENWRISGAARSRRGFSLTTSGERWSSQSTLSRRSGHQIAFGLFGLFCTKQPLVLLLL